MKVAILNRWFMTGGTENAMIGMINELLKRGSEVTVISYYDVGDMKSRIPSSVKMEVVEHSFLTETLLMHYSNNVFVRYFQKVIHKSVQIISGNKTFTQMYRFVMKPMPCRPEEYDLLLDFYGYGYFMTAYGTAKVKARKKATWLHDEDTSFAEWVRPFYDEYDALFCVSNAVRNNLLSRYPELEEKTEVLFNFIDIDRIKTMAEADEVCPENYNEKFCLLTVGRLAKQKGIDIAIRTAALLKGRGLEFKWYVLGEGYDRKLLEDLISEHNVGDCIFLLGNKGNPYPYIRKCDLYVQPSRHEGYCTTLVEAKTLGKAILSSNIESAKDLIEDGVNGYLCELNSEELASKIELIMTDRDMITKVETRLKLEADYNSNDYKKIENLMEEEA